MSVRNVVTGAGPIGWTIAEQLADQGHQVRVITRSGFGPAHPAIERCAVDVRDEGAMRAALDEAHAIFHCVHAPYTAAEWRRELPAMERTVLDLADGAVVVFPESLYSYTDPSVSMTENGPRTAVGGKRGVRTALLAAREKSATPTVSVARLRLLRSACPHRTRW